MAFGLSSPLWHQALMCLLAVGLFHLSVDARPQNTHEDDLTEEWKEAADWIVPVEDSEPAESWRAFPRSIVKSTARWWEGKLDDNLWDYEQYADGDPILEEITRDDDGDDNYDNGGRHDYTVSDEKETSPEDFSSEIDDGDDNYDNGGRHDYTVSDEKETSPEDISSAIDDDDDDKGENEEEEEDNGDDYANSSDDTSSVDASGINEDVKEAGDSSGNDKSSEEFENGYVPLGELNSFVDQSSLSSYFGNDLNKKTWAPYSDVGAVVDDDEDDDDDDDEDEEHDDDKSVDKESGKNEDAASGSTKENTNVEDLLDTVVEGGSPESIKAEDLTEDVQLIENPVTVDETLSDEDESGEESNEERDNDDDDVKDTTGNIENGDLQSDVKVFDNVLFDNVNEGVKSVTELFDNGGSDNNDDIDVIIPTKTKRSDDDGAGDDKKPVSDDDKDDGDDDDMVTSYDDLKLKGSDGDGLEQSDDTLQKWVSAEESSKNEGKDDDMFEDWADWDDSEFDDYDKEVDEKKEVDVGNAEEKLKENDSNESGDKEEYDDEDDSDDDDDDDDDNDDDDSDEVDDVFEEDDDDDDSDGKDDSDNDVDEDGESDASDTTEDSEDGDYDDEDEEDSDEDDKSDDYYDEDDDDDDDDDEEEDDEDANKTGMKKASRVGVLGVKPRTERKQKQTQTPNSESKSARRMPAAVARQTVKDLDIDSLSVQPADDAVPVDVKHYNKGTIYDSSHPFKKIKPSVKKDLDGPKSTHHLDTIQTPLQEFPSQPQPAQDDKEKIIIEEEEKEDVKLENGDESKKSEKSTERRQVHLEEKMSTGLESLTSPNPAPTVTTWTDTSKPSMPPSSSPSSLPSPSSLSSSSSSSQWAATDHIMLGDQAHRSIATNEDDDIGEAYVNSYPLETCRLDYECRSGRTCVEGVCKCFRAAFCAGHYKPVCGSDGVQYPSHCELHRTSCLNRKRIRIDRTGRCFKAQILRKEKSWLLEQEHLLEEDQKKQTSHEHENAVHISSDKIKEFPRKNSDKDTYQQSASPVLNENLKSQVPVTEKKNQHEESCTWQQLAKFKEDLLLYHCQRFVEPNCKLEVKTDRQYLSMLMFSSYDRNFDFFLTADELEKKESDEHFSNEIFKNCHLSDFVRYADTDQMDGKLTVSEFTKSFELPKSTNPVQNKLEVVSTLASAGDGLELKCGVKADRVVWKRYGIQLEDDEKTHKLMVFEDGGLFFSKLNLHHIGNYTCMDTLDEKNAQVHKLSIQTSPIVEVSPVAETNFAGSDVELRCHAEGVPKPTITWKHNDAIINYSKHTSVYTGHEHIVIHNAQPDKDAGTYVCSAHSQAGTTQKTVTVNIIPPLPYPSYEPMKNIGTFLVFHGEGITAYDPLHCVAHHKVAADFGKFKFIPDAIDSPLRLCKEGKSCNWGHAVKVGSEFVYVSQPDQNRVLVMESGNVWNPIQVIETDHQPEKLQYVPHLDQVWVLCRDPLRDDNTEKIIMVIRDAGQHIQHRSVHTRPVGNHFDMVENLFIAPSNDLRHEFDHGYVTHADQLTLDKISLEDMSYTQGIDLSMYSCKPINVAFVPLGGHVIIQCDIPNGQLQLVMDYLTNAIVSTTSVSGRPLVSPDSRHLITVDEFSGKVIVASVSAEGQMETTYEVTVSTSISDVSFIPSVYHHGYDLILTSADDDDVIVMNLVTGKVEKMSGSKQFESSQAWHPSSVHRKIVAGDPMSEFVMSPSKSALAIINFKFKRVDCEFTELKGNKVMVHISSPRTAS